MTLGLNWEGIRQKYNHQKRLTNQSWKVTYYQVFQNIRNISQELHLLLAPDKEHKKVFPNVPVVELRNDNSIKDYLVRAVLPKTNETGRCEPCGKKTCLVCNSIIVTRKKYYSFWNVKVWWSSLSWKSQN